jgi:hypothetical protein
MRTTVSIIALVALLGYLLSQQTVAPAVDEQFTEFIQTYRKSYFSNEEYNTRLATF